jgi:hypothetical protein
VPWENVSGSFTIKSRLEFRYNYTVTKLKITSIANSAGVILPKELRISKGAILTVMETPTGVALSAYDSEFEESISLAEEIMREDRDALKKRAQ